MNKTLLGSLASTIIPFCSASVSALGSYQYTRSYVPQRQIVGQSILEPNDIEKDFDPRNLSNELTQLKDIHLQKNTAVTELVIIDQGVEDKHVFYQLNRPGVVIREIHSNNNGLIQLEEILAEFEGLEALHLVSHANDGVLYLGNSQVDQQLLQERVNTLSSIDNALKDGADLILYGCNLAKGQKGDELLELISNKANVDVAASDDFTGNKLNGGDWELEIAKGDIETERPFSENTLKDFSSVLATYTPTDFCTHNGNYCGGNATEVTSSTDLTISGDGTEIRRFPLPGIIYSYKSMSNTAVDITFTASGGLSSFDLDALALNLYGTSCTSITVTNNSAQTIDTISSPGPGAENVTVGTNSDGISSVTISATGCGNSNLVGVTSITVSSASSPEINLQGNSQTISDGDIVPTTSDHTDFGSHIQGGSNLVRTFTIQNTGTGSLDLTGSPLVAISGSSDFSVTTQPASDPVSAAGSTTFQVTLDPTTVGTQNADISIANDDSDENPYNFRVTATVNAPDSDATLTAGPGAEATGLATTVDTEGEHIDVFDFTITDPGGGDGVGITISQIIIDVTGTSTDAERNDVIWRINGPDVTDMQGSYSAVNNNITFNETITVADGASETYTINAYFDNSFSVVEDRTFILTLEGDNTDNVTVEAGGTQMSAGNTAINNGGATWDVVATQLFIATGASGIVSGEVMTTQPVIEARDDEGNIDVDFTESVTASTTQGSLSNSSVTAVSGIATFTNLTHTATSDGQGLQITFDDTVGGIEPSLVNTGLLLSDVVATSLEFQTQPAGSTSGSNLTTQPVVRAVGPNSVVDTDFTEIITLTEASLGTLSGASVAASNGVATFTSVNYTASVDQESFTLTADDQAGVGTDLSPVGANAVTSDVVATGLAFGTQPAGSVSGVALTTQPVVNAVDGDGTVDTDFTEIITLTENGSGSVTGAAVSAVAGVATFTALTYTATADQENFTLTADDQGGVGADFATVDANQLTSDVVATQLVFDTQPVPLIVNNLEATNFTTVPVVSARDGDNIIDTGYSTDITIAEVNGPGSATMTGTGDTDGSGATVSISPSSGVSTFTGLQITYTASGGSSENFNLEASSGGLSTADSSQLTGLVPDSDGDLIASATVTEPVALNYSVDTVGEAVNIFDFTISDAGTADALTLEVSQVVVNVSGTSSDAERDAITWRLNGNDASNVTGIYSAGADTITFSGLSISITDGGSEPTPSMVTSTTIPVSHMVIPSF